MMTLQVEHTPLSLSLLTCAIDLSIPGGYRKMHMWLVEVSVQTETESECRRHIHTVIEAGTAVAVTSLSITMTQLLRNKTIPKVFETITN